MDCSMTTRTRALGLALAAATTVVLWQFTAGRYLLYPFTILATWFHEMGHGLCAMLLGGSFVSLSLFPDGSGYAVHSGSRFFGRPGLALVAAAGPLGPALAGALLILFSLRPKWSRRGLTGMALALGHPADGPHAVASGVEPRPGAAGNRQVIVATPRSRGARGRRPV
jgi:hypothetical protein